MRAQISNVLGTAEEHDFTVFCNPLGPGYSIYDYVYIRQCRTISHVGSVRGGLGSGSEIRARY